MSSYRLGLVSERPATPARTAPVSDKPANPASQAPTSFDQLGLTPDLLRTVAAQGYTEPTPVQAQSIPIVLAGRDLLAGAQTGTGKTAAFVLPILQLLDAGRPAVRYVPGGKGRRGATGLPIRCLVLTPTRELALQVEESVRTYGAERPIRSTTIYGGVGFQPQVRALRDGPEIVVATPGRLLDHAGQGTIDLRSVEILVLDEADRMLDMGFIRDIRRILDLLPARRQNLLFSATFSDEIRELAGGLLHDPAYVQIARRNAPIELVRQVVYPVDRERKRELLSHLVRSGRIDRALVFTRTKHGANRLAEQLGADGILAADDPRQQEPGPASPGARRLQGWASRHPRGDRGRVARPGYRRPAARGQLRASDRAPGLRPSHRPDRSGRNGGRRRFARLHRRDDAARRHRNSPPRADPARGRARLRGRPLDPARADPPAQRRRSTGRRPARPGQTPGRTPTTDRKPTRAGRTARPGRATRPGEPSTARELGCPGGPPADRLRLQYVRTGRTAPRPDGRLPPARAERLQPVRLRSPRGGPGRDLDRICPGPPPRRRPRNAVTARFAVPPRAGVRSPAGCATLERRLTPR